MTTPPPSTEVSLDSRDLDHLRNLRAEVHDLLTVLDNVRKGETTLTAHVQYIETTVQDILHLIPGLKEMERKHGGEDTIRHLRNLLENMGENPLLVNPADTTRSAQDQLRYLNLLTEQCKKLIYRVGMLTIPERVNEWLKKAWPGYYIPFHAVFEHELPVYEDRVRVLEHMSWTPKLIPQGVINPATGLIYKYSNQTRWLIGSLLLLLAAIGVVVWFLLGAPGWIGSAFKEVEDQPGTSLIVLWGVLVAGVVVHVVVATFKRMRTTPDRPPIFALHSIFPLINAKVGNILFKLVLTTIGLIGLIFTVDPDKVTLLSAFLIGYSLDSVVELFGSSAEQMATAQVASLKKQLGVTNA